MSTHFPAESMTHWENTLYEGHIATDFNAQYFTTGILTGLRGQDLIHGPENQITYLRALEQGCTYVIVPNKALLTDHVARCKTLGLNTYHWKTRDNYVPDETQIVFMALESVGTTTFHR